MGKNTTDRNLLSPCDAFRGRMQLAREKMARNARPLNEWVQWLYTTWGDGASQDRPRRGRLNPRFSLWMMGFPSGWLDPAPTPYGPSETQSSLRSPSS